MKLFNLFFLLLVSLSFVACDDDEDPVSSEDGIVGTWSAQSFEFDLESSTTSPDFDVETVSSGTATALDYTLTFTAEGNWTAVGSYTLNITSSSDGVQTSAQENMYSSVTNSGTYTVAGDLLTINESFFTLELDGMTLGGGNGPQVVPFAISGNTLTFTQDDETEVMSGTATTSSKTFSESVWARK